jgi:hypothetical protein
LADERAGARAPSMRPVPDHCVPKPAPLATRSMHQRHRGGSASAPRADRDRRHRPVRLDAAALPHEGGAPTPCRQQMAPDARRTTAFRSAPAPSAGGAAPSPITAGVCSWVSGSPARRTRWPWPESRRPRRRTRRGG